MSCVKIPLKKSVLTEVTTIVRVILFFVYFKMNKEKISQKKWQKKKEFEKLQKYAIVVKGTKTQCEIFRNLLSTYTEILRNCTNSLSRCENKFLFYHTVQESLWTEVLIFGLREVLSYDGKSPNYGPYELLQLL